MDSTDVSVKSLGPKELEVLRALISDLNSYSCFTATLSLGEVSEILNDMLDPSVTLCYPKFYEGLRAAAILMERLASFEKQLERGVTKIALFPTVEVEKHEDD